MRGGCDFRAAFGMLERFRSPLAPGGAGGDQPERAGDHHGGKAKPQLARPRPAGEMPLATPFAAPGAVVFSSSTS